MVWESEVERAKGWLLRKWTVMDYCWLYLLFGVPSRSLVARPSRPRRYGGLVQMVDEFSRGEDDEI